MDNEKCKFGHVCDSSCGHDRECPCQADHCCQLTTNCDGCDDHHVKYDPKLDDSDMGPGQDR